MGNGYTHHFIETNTPLYVIDKETGLFRFATKEEAKAIRERRGKALKLSVENHIGAAEPNGED